MIGIADGDTLTVLDASHQQHKIRLSGIDAPERGQPFGTVSGDHLGERVFGKQVTIEYNKRDRYGRIVGKVLDSVHDVNLEQIDAGLAWHYKEYQYEQNPLDRQIYADTEIEARREKRGLWQDPHPIPPWDWRRGIRAAVPSELTVVVGKECSITRTCNQFASCAEAMTYARQCGSAGLDGDGDGMPCEAMCR